MVSNDSITVVVVVVLVSPLVYDVICYKVTVLRRLECVISNFYYSCVFTKRAVDIILLYMTSTQGE